VEICRHIVAERWTNLKLNSNPKATVCKYVVTERLRPAADHSDAASSRAKIEVGDVGKARLYYSSVDKKETVCIWVHRALSALSHCEHIGRKPARLPRKALKPSKAPSPTAPTSARMLSSRNVLITWGRYVRISLPILNQRRYLCWLRRQRPQRIFIYASGASSLPRWSGTVQLTEFQFTV